MYYKTPTMRVEGGWVGMRTRSAAARATVRYLSHQCTVAGRPTERGDGTRGRSREVETRWARHRAATVISSFCAAIFRQAD